MTQVTRIALNGAAGRMGLQVRAAIDADLDAVLSAALEHPRHPELGRELAPGVVLGSDAEQAFSVSNVAIDFSLPEASVALAEAAARHKCPLVVATTGFRPEQLARVQAAAEHTAVLIASNFSLGVNVLIELVEQAARRLSGYDIEVLEIHHGSKVDAPSGTALTLARAAAEARGQKLDEVAIYARKGHTGARVPGEIGLQTLRAGQSPGEHTIYIAGPGERIELTHRAFSREGFASGSVRAAHWLRTRPPGLYSMRDVLDG